MPNTITLRPHVACQDAIADANEAAQIYWLKVHLAFQRGEVAQTEQADFLNRGMA